MTSFALLESGDKALLESGDELLLEDHVAAVVGRQWTYDGDPPATYGGTAAATYPNQDDWTYEPVTG